jgi:amicoumacin kinase
MDAAVLERAASLYATQPSELTPLQGGHVGSVYRFVRGNEPYVLRIVPAGNDLDGCSALSIASWMLHLADNGAPVSRPLVSEQKRLVETIEHAGCGFVVTALHEATGVLGESLPMEAWDAGLCRSLGRAVGAMHALSRRYIRPDELVGRPAWEEVGSCFNPTTPAAPMATVVADRRAEVLRLIGNLPTDSDSFGLIHADLHYANLFVDIDAGLVTFFDFDDCCYGWYAMDIAMSLFDTVVLYGGPDGESFAEAFLRNYLIGYIGESPLRGFWVTQLPHFLKLLEIGVYLLVERAYESGTDDPWISKFMPGRRERIEARVPFIDLPFAELAQGLSDMEPGGPGARG